MEEELTATIESYTSIIANKDNFQTKDDGIYEIKLSKEINLNETVDKLNYDISLDNVNKENKNIN